MQLVPKMLKPLVMHRAPDAYVVSFKVDGAHARANFHR
jgi:hypothetical protein